MHTLNKEFWIAQLRPRNFIHSLLITINNEVSRRLIPSQPRFEPRNLSERTDDATL